MTKASVNALAPRLWLGTAAVALVTGSAGALAQDDAADAKRTRNLVKHSWTLETSLFATDNYRRLPELLTRQHISGTPPLQLRASQEVTVDPPNNAMVSGTISGSTLIRKPMFSGLVSGSLVIGTYLNSDSLDERLLRSASPDVPKTALFKVPGVEKPIEREVVSATFGLPDRSEVFIDPNLRAAGTARVVDNLFYVDAGALVIEKSLGLGGSIAQEGVGQSGDEVVYGGVSVSPYLFRAFTDESTVEIRFRATAIDVLREDIDLARDRRFTDKERASLADAQIENDSRSAEVVAEYNSGDLFDRFSFQLGAFGRKVGEDGSDLPNARDIDFTQSSASLDIAYGVNKSFSLTGGVGIDDIAFDDLDIAPLSIPAGATAQQTAALKAARQAKVDRQADQDLREDELSGVFWRLGFRYAPSRRTDLEVSVGERFGGTAVEAEATYKPSARIRASVGATRQFDSGLQDFASSALQFQTQAFQVLTSLADGQAGTASALLDRALAFQGGSFRDVQRGQTGFGAFNRLRVGIQGSFRRTNFGANVQHSETDRRGEDASLLSADASIDRQISRRFSINGQVRYSLDGGSIGLRDRVGSNGAETPVTFEAAERMVRFGTAYQAGTKLSLTGQVYRVVREADESTPGTQFDYEENAIGLGLRWMF